MSSFTTAIADIIVTPPIVVPAIAAPQLISPEAGVHGVSLRPVFKWSAVAGASSYELLVATNPSFIDPLIVKIGDYALHATAWKCNVSLNYNTIYYWNVRAGGFSGYGDWSNIGIFITELPPPESSPTLGTVLPELLPPEASSSELPPAQSAVLNWAKYLIGGLFLIIVLLMISLVTLVERMRRL